MARSSEDGSRRSPERGVYVISVAADLVGVHPQTLRIYERKGLLSPSRTAGNTRRYSERDIERLRTIQRLSQEYGINLAGVKMIVEMENELERMRDRMRELDAELQRVRRRVRDEARQARRETRGEIVRASELRELRRRLAQVAMAAEPERRPIAVGPVRG